MNLFFSLLRTEYNFFFFRFIEAVQEVWSIGCSRLSILFQWRRGSRPSKIFSLSEAAKGRRFSHLRRARTNNARPSVGHEQRRRSRMYLTMQPALSKTMIARKMHKLRGTSASTRARTANVRKAVAPLRKERDGDWSWGALRCTGESCPRSIYRPACERTRARGARVRHT